MDGAGVVTARMPLDRTVYRAAGLGVPVRIRQLRAWASSCVLEVRCETATAYFKALPHSGRVEFAVTRWLSEAFPDVVPRVIACDAGRRWLLMQACAGVLLEGVPDITAWARAARRYGQLQVACAVRGDVLQALGCRVRGLASLVPAMTTLAGDREALRVGEPEGVTEAQLEQLRDSLPTLERRCVELDGIGVPYTLEHGDRGRQRLRGTVGRRVRDHRLGRCRDRASVPRSRAVDGGTRQRRTRNAR